MRHITEGNVSIEWRVGEKGGENETRYGKRVKKQGRSQAALKRK
jgi:hypothetical protein